jgi:hypothetical protein
LQFELGFLLHPLLDYALDAFLSSLPLMLITNSGVTMEHSVILYVILITRGL